MSYIPHIATIIDFIPVIIGLIYFKRLNSTLRIVALLLLIAALVDSASWALIVHHYPTIWLIHSLSLVEGIATSYIIFSLAGSGRKVIYYWLLYSTLFTLHWIYTTFRNNGFSVLDAEQQSLKTLSFAVFSGIGFVKLGLSADKSFVKDYRLIFLFGIFESNILTLFIELTVNANIAEGGLGMKYGWALFNSVNILTNLLFSAALISFLRKEQIDHQM